MTPDPKLHHSAKRIVPDSLETLIEIFEILGCKLTYRKEGARWAMIGQDGLDFDIQLFEVDAAPVESPIRINSHIAFISEDPAKHIAAVEEWAMAKGVKFIKGEWSEKELWFDLPELFVDSVIEVMNVSILSE